MLSTSTVLLDMDTKRPLKLHNNEIVKWLLVSQKTNSFNAWQKSVIWDKSKEQSEEKTFFILKKSHTNLWQWCNIAKDVEHSRKKHFLVIDGRKQDSQINNGDGIRKYIYNIIYMTIINIYYIQFYFMLESNKKHNQHSVNEV